MINSLRYIMLGIMGLYIIPVIMALVYCQCNVVIDIIFSTFSFLFYSPTYLNILNIYALCRMDDISWGTKGLDT
jgi:chitin synthase